MKTVCFITLGCKVNQYETQVLRETFLNNGFTEAQRRADVCVVNTCSVTSNADAKSRDAIRRARAQHPDARLVVTGCLAEYDRQQIKDLIEGKKNGYFYGYAENYVRVFIPATEESRARDVLSVTITGVSEAHAYGVICLKRGSGSTCGS